MPDGSDDAALDAAPILPDAQTGVVEAGSGAPTITAVHISQIGQNIHIEVDGSGFGTAPTPLPFVGELAVFGITDITQGGWCAGASNCPVQLQYTSWTDESIVIDGFGPQYGGVDQMAPGDAVRIVVRGSTAPSGAGSASWTGAIENEAPPPLDPGGPTPRVASVAFSTLGQNMHIEIDGAGFGPAPIGLPFVGELGVFGLYAPWALAAISLCMISDSDGGSNACVNP